MFGCEKKYGEQRIEPKNSIAENAKIKLDLGTKKSIKTMDRYIYRTKLKKVFTLLDFFYMYNKSYFNK